MKNYRHPQSKIFFIKWVLILDACLKKVIAHLKKDLPLFRQAQKKQLTSSPLFYSQTEFFKHQTVVFTGALKSLSRQEAIALIGQLGGTVGSSVTKKTNIVVTGIKNIYELSPNEMSTKLRKAIELVYHGQDILFLNEEEFLTLSTSS